MMNNALKMNLLASVLLSTVSVGCLPAGSQPLSDFPDGVLAYEYVKETWRNTPGLPHRDDLDNRACDIDNVYVVTMNAHQLKEEFGKTDAYALTPEELQAQCFDGNVDCAVATWQPVRPRVSVIAFVEEMNEYERRYNYYHELVHFFVDCTGWDRNGDLDGQDHEDPRLWGQTGLETTSILACRADYTNGASVADQEEMAAMGLAVCPFDPAY